jgi:hypothetical protein
MADYGLLAGFKGIGGAQREAEQRALETQVLQAKLAASARGADLPSAVQEYQYYNQLDPQSQAKYLQMKRADKIIDTGGGFARFDPISGQALPVGAGGMNGGVNQPLVKTFDPEEQRKADMAAREEKDKFERALDVQKKALRAAENLVGRVDPITGEQVTEGNVSGVRANRGGLSRFFPNVSNSAVDAEADLTTLSNLLTTENLGLLKGVLSDTDMKVLASIGSGELAGSDKKALAALRRMRSALSGRVTGMQGAKDSMMPNELPPLSSEFLNMPPEIDAILGGINPNQSKAKLGSIPTQAVKDLRANPNTAAQFDEVFGAGASKMVLGR